MLVASLFLAATLTGGLALETHSTLVNHNDSPSRKLVANSASESAVVCPWPSTVCDLKSTSLFLGDTTCAVPIPVPIDNYLDDNRVNKYDTDMARSNSYIEVTSTFNGVSTTTGKTSWQKYKRNPSAALRAISLSTPGVYNLSITAKDYDYSASCSGCVAIRDAYRPRFKSGKCPPDLPDTAIFSIINWTVFENAETTFDTYVGDNNVDNNGAPTTALCNSSIVATKRTMQETADSATTTCWDKWLIKSNINKFKVNPLTGSNLGALTSTLEATLNAQCRWCCTKSRTLYENYVPYSCPLTAAPPAPTCVGDSTIASSCTLQGCMISNGPGMIKPPAALATIKSTVKRASQTLLNELPALEADTSRTVLRSIPCTSFSASAACKYTAKVTDLLDFASLVWSKGLYIEHGYSTSDFDFWRINTDGQTWRAFDPKNDTTAIDFMDASTTVEIQLWTACGMVSSFSFNVQLVLHNSMTCSGFEDIWVPETIWGSSGGFNGTNGAYCAHGFNSFGLVKAQLTTGILSTILPTDNQTAQGKFARMDCSIRVRDSTAVMSTPAVNFLTMTSTGTNYFAVDLMDTPMTSRATTAEITCSFSRSSRANVAGEALATDSITCPPRTITFMDCEAPVFSVNNPCSGDCGGKARCGETCGGTVITSDGNTTSIKPTAAQPCCNTATCNLVCASTPYYFSPATGSAATSVKKCQPA